jgi:hypothetical protein
MMPIRKHGSGEVLPTESSEATADEGLVVTGGASGTWGHEDDEQLADENTRD